MYTKDSSSCCRTALHRANDEPVCGSAFTHWLRNDKEAIELERNQNLQCE